MKLLIAGSRSFDNYELLCNEMKSYDISKIDYIISGTARGADKLGERFARDNNIKILSFPAEWDKYGKSAGYKRNLLMGEECDEAIIFYDGSSKGSMHMINILKEKNKKYKVINY